MNAAATFFLERSAQRYAAVGVANTALGLGIIFAAKAMLGLGDVGANVLGYGIAVLVGFALNKRWTFEHRGNVPRALLRYLVVLLAAYAANLCVTLVAIQGLHVNSYWAQAMGVVPYAVTGYLGSRFFVFAPAADGGRAGWLGECMACIREDAAFHAFVAAYAAIVLVTAWRAGVPHKFVPLTYVFFSLPLSVFAIVIALGVWSLWSREPFAALRRAAGMARNPQVIAACVLFATLCVHMGVFTSMKALLPDVVPFHADRVLADFDEALHGAAPWRYTTALLPPEATAIICPVYFGIWGLLLPTALIACLFMPQLRGVRDQYLWTYLIAWPLLGNLVAGAAMSGGPMFYGLITGDEARFSELLRYLAHFPPLGEGAAYLWQTYVSGQPSVATGISAFPSMHLANATMLVLLAARLGRRWLCSALAFCAFVLFASVHLGWHYAIDGYFSIAATALLWWCVGRVLRAFGPRVTRPAR